MDFRISRELLLRPLQLVSGVVERRSARGTRTILKNIQLKVEGGQLTLVGTDLEVEWSGKVAVEEMQAGETTVPAQKLLEICRELPEGADIHFRQNAEKFIVESGPFWSSLSSLPADEFPSVELSDVHQEVTVESVVLGQLIGRTGFSMAQQDVRYYLNGALLELTAEHIRLVATNGHRLAMSEHLGSFSVSKVHQVILPRKGVLELQKLVGEKEGSVVFSVCSSHFRATLDDFTLTGKLVDGKYPEYTRVIPKEGNRVLVVDREALRSALSRTAILSNDKYRSVRLKLDQDVLDLSANNPEQEEARESLSVEYQGETIEVGFNFVYLLDVLRVLDGEKVRVALSDSSSSALINDPDEDASLYVVMPMKL